MIHHKDPYQPTSPIGRWKMVAGFGKTEWPPRSAGSWSSELEVVFFVFFPKVGGLIFGVQEY